MRGPGRLVGAGARTGPGPVRSWLRTPPRETVSEAAQHGGQVYRPGPGGAGRGVPRSGDRGTWAMVRESGPGADVQCFVPQVLAAVVLLSWGFVLYGARVTAQRQLVSGLLAQGLP